MKILSTILIALCFINCLQSIRTRSRGTSITAHIYQQHIAAHQKIVEDTREKYLLKAEEYEKQKAIERNRISKEKMEAGLQQLKSAKDKKRFIATCIKWNWSVERYFDEWNTPEASKAGLLLYFGSWLSDIY
jgi:hypothetical protein